MYRLRRAQTVPSPEIEIGFTGLVCLLRRLRMELTEEANLLQDSRRALCDAVADGIGTDQLSIRPCGGPRRECASFR